MVELRAANRLKTRFLANMSHELRIPLNSIIGFSEMLRDEIYGPLNETQKEYVDIVLKSSRHLHQLLSDILDLCRVEQDMTLLAKQQVRIEDLIEATVSIVRPQAEAAGLRLTVDTSPDLPPLWADPLRIKQVLYNLLSNAIKFTPSGGAIEVRARHAGGEAAVAVSDTGIGISEEDQAHVCDGRAGGAPRA